MSADTLHVATRYRALLDLDPELAEGVPAAQRGYARKALQVPVVRVPRGIWDPMAEVTDVGHAFALLLVSGIAIREVLIASDLATELLGPGDAVAPWTPPAPMLPAVVSFRVAATVEAAVLDDRLLGAIRAWPQIAGILVARLARQDARQATQRAISQLTRVEDRLLALLWHLAERWGHVTPAGVRLQLGLSHETMGRLVGARRPTVSIALKALAASGAVVRAEDGSWLLDRTSAGSLAVPETARHHSDATLLQPG